MSEVSSTVDRDVADDPDPGGRDEAVTGHADDSSSWAWLRDDQSTFRRTYRYLAMPLFLLVLLGGLWVWVTGQQLDSVEQRALNATYISARLQEHITLTLLSTVAVLVIAIPLGVIATRPGRERAATVITGLGNAGQAIPSLGMLGILFYGFFAIDFLPIPATGTFPAVVALTAYSLLPILRNTMVGIRGVDDAILESGRGMGLSNRHVLRRLELPLAVPVILAGVRTALVLNVGTAALAFILGGGGLGEMIVQGYQLNRLPVLLTGAFLTAALALAIDWLAGIAEEQLTPQGL